MIKLWFRAPGARSYPLEPTWPEVESLRELAESTPFRDVFAMPFTTIVLSCDAVGIGDSGWSKPLTPAQLAREADEFEELTQYLSTQFRNSDKTFILQNWEGDWAVRSRTDPSLAAEPFALAGMIARLDNRQAAVECGRRGAAGTRVAHAAEVNLVLPESVTGPTVTEAVLSHTECDLFSYSAWETTASGNRFVEALTTIRDATSPSEMFGRDNVFVGEFGAPEVAVGREQAADITRRTIADAVRFGCPYILYWQIFDNEGANSSGGGDDFPGFWLIRPDGSSSKQRDVLADELSCR